MTEPFRYQAIPRIIAHRCNDLTSVTQVVEQAKGGQLFYMECDVRTTADKVLVAHHDPVYQGQVIAETVAADLQGEILSLDGLLDAIRGKTIILHLDVKANESKGKWQAAADSEQLFALLEEKQLTEKVIITAVAGAFLRHFRKLSKKIKLGVLYDEDYGTLMPPNKKAVNVFVNKILEYHQQVVIDGIFMNQKWLQVFEKQYGVLDTFFYTIHKAGIKIAIWTVNDPALARHFVAQGAEWITTDFKVKHQDLGFD
ncbi:glycerophosphodiester phosphodiesterase [bacterium]|nr:glycerophosphodiester phosphodiesterase [bacterium]